eukprot:scaffold8053_cov146-Isochrysis_galbana.AAC.2
MLYPQGIDVPAPAEGQPLVHFDVSSRQAHKPNPAKRRVAASILARIAITVQHFELRGLAQFIRPGDLAAGWAALGFDRLRISWDYIESGRVRGPMDRRDIKKKSFHTVIQHR